MGTLPGSILVNAKTGVARILSADELDLGHGWVRKGLEMGFRNRFWTMFYGEHRLTDKQYKMAGIDAPAKKEPVYGPPKEDPMAAAGELVEEVVKTKPDLGQFFAEQLIEPASIATGREERKKKYANRQTRNIY